MKGIHENHWRSSRLKRQTYGAIGSDWNTFGGICLERVKTTSSQNWMKGNLANQSLISIQIEWHMGCYLLG
jgi:hypothetical protein